MSLKKEFNSKCSVTLNGMSLKMKFTLKMDCHSKWKVIKNGMSLKMECYSK